MAFDSDLFFFIREGTEDKEEKLIGYLMWVLSLNEEQRSRHYRCSRKLIDIVCYGYYACGDAVRYVPECDCQICNELYSDAQIKVAARAEQRRLQKNCKPKDDRTTNIYVMRNERSGHIKIGRSIAPFQREATLQAEEPAISMLFFFPAIIGVEHELHREFSGLRVRGEWFSLSQSQVESIRNRYGVEAA
jgi:hypothetical protein